MIVLGAGGRLGSRVLAAAAQAGHDVTAYVRSAQRLRAAVGEELLQKVQVVEGDAEDRAQLAEAMRGQEAAVQVRRGAVGRVQRAVAGLVIRCCSSSDRQWN